MSCKHWKARAARHNRQPYDFLFASLVFNSTESGGYHATKMKKKKKQQTLAVLLCIVIWYGIQHSRKKPIAGATLYSPPILYVVLHWETESVVYWIIALLVRFFLLYYYYYYICVQRRWWCVVVAAATWSVARSIFSQSWKLRDSETIKHNFRGERGGRGL